MSVKIRPYRNGGWEADINVPLPDGTRYRERKKVSVSSKSGALRWAQARERELLVNGPPKPQKEVPTLEEFAPRFMDGHARANQQKPSGIAAKEMILRVHLNPALGAKALDAITNEDVQRLKFALAEKQPKTVNNVLTVLSVLLKKAVEWKVIDRMPCAVRMIRVPKRPANFYTSSDYEKLVQAAETVDSRALLIVLLGGEVGLRCGEMVALQWSDIDFTRRQVCIQRSAWKGRVSAPKNGRIRHVGLTHRVADALRKSRHLRGPLVLYQDSGEPFTEKAVQSLLLRAARHAGVFNNGPHMLRHTFCSRLAAEGAPARAIQDLAGHQDLATTQRYMHVSRSETESAIRLLEKPSGAAVGDGVETQPAEAQSV